MSPVLVKICGITRPEDAGDAVRAGADWLGLNFWPGSKRFIADPARGRAIVEAARRAALERAQAGGGEPGRVFVVGVFVNQPAAEIAAMVKNVGLDAVQLHGDESTEDCAVLVRAGLCVIKAAGISGLADVDRLARHPVDTVLVDAPQSGYGGAGKTFDWDLARAAVATGKRVILAGGLRPENVASAVAEVMPFAVDVASGVESAPGIKDPDRVRAFVAAAKQRVSGSKEQP